MNYNPASTPSADGITPNTPDTQQPEEQQQHPEPIPPAPTMEQQFYIMQQLLTTLGINAAHQQYQPQPQPTPNTTAIRSERTPDVESPSMTSDPASNLSAIDVFETRLRTKFAINADRYPTPISRVHYVFARLPPAAATAIQPSVADETLADWTDLIAFLRDNFGVHDAEWHYHSKFLSLRQNNRTFTEFYAEFKLVGMKTTFWTNKPALRHQLRFALSRELTDRLQQTDLKGLAYEQLVEECYRLGAHLQSLHTRTTPWTRNTAATSTRPTAPAPPTIPARAVQIAAATTPVAPITFAAAGPDRMELDQAAKKEFRRLNNLCFYCGEGHRINDCPRQKRARPNPTLRVATVEHTPTPAAPSVAARSPVPASPSPPPSENGVSLV